MNENEKPALGSTEAAVLTVVELIARAAQMSEQHMSYWLDLYYQVRFKHEATEIYGELTERTAGPDPVMARLGELEKKIDELKNGVTFKMDVRPVHPYRTAEDVLLIRPQDLPADQDPATEGPREWHSIVPPTPPDKYPPAPPRPAGRIKPEDLAAEPDPAAEFIKQFAEADEGDTSSDASDAGDARAGDDQAAGARKEREPQRGRQTAKGPGARVQDARGRPSQGCQDARRQDR